MPETFSLVHAPSGITVATVRRTDGWWAQGRGVLGLAALPPGEGLWLPGVASVHTLFARFPLDLLFLQADLETVRCVPGVRPWTPLVRAPGARHTIELGARTLAQAGIEPLPGERWALKAISQEKVSETA